jgi:hypothetical protein
MRDGPGLGRINITNQWYSAILYIFVDIYPSHTHNEQVFSLLGLVELENCGYIFVGREFVNVHFRGELTWCLCIRSRIRKGIETKIQLIIVTEAEEAGVTKNSL